MLFLLSDQEPTVEKALSLPSPEISLSPLQSNQSALQTQTLPTGTTVGQQEEEEKSVIHQTRWPCERVQTD